MSSYTVESKGEQDKEPELSEGYHDLEIIEVGPTDQGKFGPYIPVQFIDDEGNTVKEIYSLKLSTQSKLGKLVRAVEGSVPGEGEEYDLEDLVGNTVGAVIEHEETDEFINAKIKSHTEADEEVDFEAEEGEEVPF